MDIFIKTKYLYVDQTRQEKKKTLDQTGKNIQALLGWAPQMGEEEQGVGPSKPTAFQMWSRDQQCMGSVQKTKDTNSKCEEVSSRNRQQILNKAIKICST